MADLWELICHHIYGGIPGVVVDLSPRAASHGQAVGLDDGDFLADGTAPGSGAVRFYKQDGRIHVQTQTIPWNSIVGIRGEVTLRRQPALGFIIDSDAFQFHVRGNSLDIPVAWFSCHPNQYAEISTLFDPVGPSHIAFRQGHGSRSASCMMVSARWNCTPMVKSSRGATVRMVR